MNLIDLERKLLAAAKAHPLDDRVPYAFEQRIMAALRQPSALDRWSQWAAVFWRAAAPGVAITVLLSAWVLGLGLPATSESLDADFETTVCAAIDAGGDLW